MNRRLSVALAAYGAWNQAVLLFAFDPMKHLVIDTLAPGSRIPDVRVLGLSLDGFAVHDLDRAEGWLPQAVFVVLSGILTYGVFRGARWIRPRTRTVLALVGAVLLASGVATLIGPLLGPDARSAVPTYGEWLGYARLGAVPAAAAQFALGTVWLQVAVWSLIWRYRHAAVLVEYLGTTEGPQAEEAPVPLLTQARERRDLVCAALIPTVLLAVAGGPFLRHTRVRPLVQSSSGTFDPELWTAYRPPAAVEEWSGLLYPALRLRPVGTERISGWIATLAVCAVLLVASAVALRSVAGRVEAGRRPAASVRLFMRGWYVTLLGAVAAAFVDGWLLQWFAPRLSDPESVRPLWVAVGDAVRFGTAWGWATGAACLGAVLLLTHRGREVAPAADVDEGELNVAR
ncbi:hypothetical protein [Streptomyces sp. NPDC059446]|uniref:hypothetical protein n=1 Tax=Streptomyces sp. NPDC059446 TaxID=3346833 RepID=UPI0036AAD44F